MDGLARGIDLFHSILRSVQNDLKPIAVAVLDLQKAFDSVSHQAIFNIIDSMNLPDIKAYLKYIYIQAEIHLSFQGVASELIHPVKRVRQKDPPSPTIFLRIMDII